VSEEPFSFACGWFELAQHSVAVRRRGDCRICEPLRFALGRIVHGADLKPCRGGRSRTLLLDNVGEFVREQPPPLGRIGGIGTATEDKMTADRVRKRSDRAS
jgi:hypothetical protein